MQGLFAALSGLASLVNLVAAIIIIIQLWKAKGALHGILGICCGLYTYVWGWQNADSLDASNPPPLGLKYKQWMLLWTAAFIASAVFSGVAQAMARSAG